MSLSRVSPEAPPDLADEGEDEETEHVDTCTDEDCPGCWSEDDDEGDSDEEDFALAGSPVPARADDPRNPGGAPVVPLPRAGDPFAPPESAAACSIRRLLPGAPPEPCEVFDFSRSMWVRQHAIPITAEEIREIWGSGTYEITYHTAAGRLAGRKAPFALEDARYPTRPARAKVEAAPVPRPRRAPPRPRPEPAPMPQGIPPVPPGGTAQEVLTLMQWAEERARGDFDRRIRMLEAEARAVEERAEARHRRDMEETEGRHRRALETQAAMARDLIATATEKAQARAPIGALRTELDELRDELDERNQPDQTTQLMQTFAPMVAQYLASKNGTPTT